MKKYFVIFLLNIRSGTPILDFREIPVTKKEVHILKSLLGIIYMFELVPSAVRARASAALTFLGFLVTGFAPTLAKTDQSVALIVFGVAGVLGGLLGMALPETAGLPLPARDDD